MGKWFVVKAFVLSACIFVLSFMGMGITVHAEGDYSKYRLAGETRYHTSVEISKNGWKDGSATVVLAKGDDYPDALSGATLAKKLNAPILLTKKDKLHQATKQEIQRLKASKVVILGGSAVKR